MKNRPDRKYRISIVSMDDRGTNSFGGYAARLRKSKGAVTANYIAAALCTVLAFIFQTQGVQGNIVCTVLAYACIFTSLLLAIELIIQNSLQGKYVHVALLALCIVAAFLLMEQLCTAYPSKAFEFTKLSDYGRPPWYIGQLFS